MRVFFGKISKSGREEDFFDKQIKEKRYYSHRGSPWFGEIQEDDYCYIIAGDKIYLWQAKKFENDYLQFEEIFEKELPINGNQFRSMKFFEFTPQIIVLTTRKARKRAPGQGSQRKSRERAKSQGRGCTQSGRRQAQERAGSPRSARS